MPISAAKTPLEVDRLTERAFSEYPSLRRLGLVTGLAVVFLAASARADGRYRIIDLGGLEGGVSQGEKINEAGEILGESSSSSRPSDASLALTNQMTSASFFAEADGRLHALPGSGVALNNRGEVAINESVTDGCGRSQRRAFVWSLRLGARPLPPLPGDIESVVVAINDTGAAVGYSADVNSIEHAVIWLNRVPQPLGTPDRSTALAVNNKSQVMGFLAGKSKGASYSYFLWTAAAGYQTAPSLTRNGDQYSQATGFNDRGQLLGKSIDTKSLDHAVLWDAQRGLIDLGQVSGDTSSTPLSLNQRGEVLAVSTAAAGGTPHFFLWDAAQGVRVVDVGRAFTSVAGLNDHDDLVGTIADRHGASRAFTYRSSGLRELGILGGDWSVGTALNDSGEVAGYALDVTGNLHAFRWSESGGLENLGDLDSGSGNSVGSGINQRGDVTGTAFKTRMTRERAFICSRTAAMRDIGSLDGANRGFSEGNGINSLGQVVGFTTRTLDNGNFTLPPFVWDAASGMHEIPLPPDFLAFLSAPAVAINDHSRVVGRGTSFSGDTGWIWDARRGTQELFTSTGSSAIPAALNNDDQIVGHALAPAPDCQFDTSRAFMTTIDGSVGDLGALAGDQISSARGINSRGQVVGDSGYPVSRAFLYEAGQMQSLTDLVANQSWTLQSAEAINDAGEITGVGLHERQVHAYLLRPLRR